MYSVAAAMPLRIPSPKCTGIGVGQIAGSLLHPSRFGCALCPPALRAVSLAGARRNIVRGRTSPVEHRSAVKKATLAQPRYAQL